MYLFQISTFLGFFGFVLFVRRPLIAACYAPGSDIPENSLQDAPCFAGTWKNIVATIVVSNETINACGGDNGKECKCSEDALQCKRLKSFNIKINKSDFVLKHISFEFIPQNILQKGLIFESTTIETIFLSCSEINEFENGIFDNIQNLKELKIEHSNLSKLNENMFTKYTTLSSLSLRYNKLNSLEPGVFGKYINLTSIDLSHNSELSSSLNKEVFTENLATLQHLFLTDCNIYSINNDAFIHLRNLQHLYLNENYLSSIPVAAKMIPNLNTLHMNGLRSTTLNRTETVTDFNSTIENLILSNTELKSIGDCAFCDLPNLKKLILSYSMKLEKIHENAFGAIDGKKVPSLETFYAESCRFTTLPEKLLEWNNIGNISFENNPFYCGDEMIWLVKLFKLPEFTNAFHGGICYEPTDFLGTNLKDLDVENDNTLIKKPFDCEYHSSGCTCYKDEAVVCHLDRRHQNLILDKFITLPDHFYINKFRFFLPSFFQESIKPSIIVKNEHLVEELEFSNVVKRIQFDEGFGDRFTMLKKVTIIGASVYPKILSKIFGTSLLDLNLFYVIDHSWTNDTFKDCKNLKNLSLANSRGFKNLITNNLLSKDLENLESLSLSNCGIEKLDDDALENLVNLKYLDLSWNFLISMPKALNQLSNLISIKISDTEITYLREDDSPQLPNLKTLEMKNMENLVAIEFCAFCGSSNLTEINLSYNRHLNKIDSNAFGYPEYNKNSMVQIFKANNCNLTYLSKNLLNWTNVKEIHIGNNPFICNFKMEWLLLDLYRKAAKYDHVSQYPVVDPNLLICDGPERFKNVTLIEAAKALYYRDPLQQQKDAVAAAHVSPFSNDNFTFGIIVFAFILFIFCITLIFCCRQRDRQQKRKFNREMENLNSKQPIFA